MRLLYVVKLCTASASQAQRLAPHAHGSLPLVVGCHVVSRRHHNLPRLGAAQILACFDLIPEGADAGLGAVEIDRLLVFHLDAVVVLVGGGGIVGVEGADDGADADDDAGRLRSAGFTRRSQLANVDCERTALVRGALLHGENVARRPQRGRLVSQQRRVGILLLQRDRGDGPSALARRWLDVDVCAAWAQAREVQQVLVCVGKCLWLAVGVEGGFIGVAAGDRVAEETVGERPWLLARRVLAGFDGLDKRVDGAESVVELGRGVADEVDAGVPSVCFHGAGSQWATRAMPYPLYFMIATLSAL